MSVTDINGNRNEILVFTLGKEEYGLGILTVQEICQYRAVTCIANTHSFIKGVINLRGSIVPVVDMRIWLNLDAPDSNGSIVVIILHVLGKTIGMVVDSVSDVVALSSDQIRPLPQLGRAIDCDHLMGLGTIDDRLILLLDTNGLLSSADFCMIEKNAA